MRSCLRCQTEMKDGFDLQVEGGAFGIRLVTKGRVFPKQVGKPKAAVCPNCGELSLYIENFEEQDLT